ncbi:MAG: hypothetical protein VB104_05980 [Candidatus Limiplasma sp.]|nr:hypothetical protein [Candidatus Limiplasma sp.]
MGFNYYASINGNIGQLIKAKNYEKILCNYLNESQYIFPEHYEQVKVQSNNECDFIDEHGRKFDAKLLFEEIQCKLLSKGFLNLEAWLLSVLSEIYESSNILMKNNRAKIEHTALYQEILRRLNSVKCDEAAILFMPFPFVPESENSVHLRDASDILSITYDAIKEDVAIHNMGTYIIYPSAIDRKIVLRDLDEQPNKQHKEYLPLGELDQYITYSLRLSE